MDQEKLCDAKSDLPIFDWRSCPRNLKTRNRWELCFRTIKKGERPTAQLRTTRQRRFESIDHQREEESFFDLYHRDQTRALKRTDLRVARWRFYKCFVESADKNRSIRWCKGGYVQDADGEEYGDETLDQEGWKTITKRVGFQEAIQHTMGNETLGIFGAKSSFFLLIDLDLHNQPKELFVRRLHALVEEFHGKWRCHFQVSDQKAGGIHLILFFGKASSLKSRRRWLLNRLAEIDKRYEGVKFTKDGSDFNIEIYPDPNKPVRLPLAVGRTMLLDKPLKLVERRKRLSQDIVGYMEWLGDKNRKFMDKNDVLDYVMKRMDWSCASEAKPKTAKPGNLETRKSGITISRSRKSLKGKTRGKLIQFWQEGDAECFANLNSAIHVTLGCLHAEGLTEDEAVELVDQYVSDLPNKNISSRQVSGTKKIRQDIARNARAIWARPVPDKLAASIERWSSIGFAVADKSTWKLSATKTVVDCVEIEFSEEERSLIINLIAPLLVGTKQARKIDKQQEVERAVAYFLRYVRCHVGQIDTRSLPVIMKTFDLKVGNHDKQSKFFRLLIKLEWIYVRVDYYSPKRYGKKGKGRARTYGIGLAMAETFGINSSSQQQQKKEIYILSPTFCEDSEFIDSIPDFATQISKLK